MATKVKLIADGAITPDQITLTTASTGTNTTAPATTAFVQQEVSALVDSSPEALNTLNELAAALGDDANFSTTVTNSIATKAPLASPTFTGTVEIPNLTISSAQGSDGQVLTSTGSGIAWEDVPSDVTVSTTAPSSPSEGDLWFDSTSGTKALKVWNGSLWKLLSSTFSASGGTETTFSGYTIHAFTSSGTFTPTVAGLVDILVVGGGGGSNDGRFNNEGSWDGGGGAGGLRYVTSHPVTAQAYTITVGAGGSLGANGGDSSGLGITSLGGGYGGESDLAGAAGGSGGGGGGDSATSGGAGTSGQGNAGGPGTDPGGDPYYEQGGGGGGAGEAGNTDGLGFGGDGQDYSTIFGTTYGESGWFAGGGAGGSGTDGSGINDGGQGGGGNSGVGYNATGSAGVAGATNTGGGGGGGRYSKAGGSGIVLIRYGT